MTTPFCSGNLGNSAVLVHRTSERKLEYAAVSLRVAKGFCTHSVCVESSLRQSADYYIEMSLQVV
jgi:hypothetical protein